MACCAWGTALGQEGDQVCKARVDTVMERCLGEVKDIALVAGQIRKCRALHEHKYRECADQRATADTGHCNRADAKINIDWVMVGDAPAYQAYRTFRAKGATPLVSVIGAQAHTPNAQQSIRNCSMWAAQYLQQTYQDRLDGPDQPSPLPGNNVDLDCIDVVSQSGVYAGSEQALFAVDIFTRNNCTIQVDAKFCVVFGKNEQGFSVHQYFNPGMSNVVRVPDPRLSSESANDPSYRYVAMQICSRISPFRCRGAC